MTKYDDEMTQGRMTKGDRCFAQPHRTQLPGKVAQILNPIRHSGFVIPATARRLVANGRFASPVPLIPESTRYHPGGFARPRRNPAVEPDHLPGTISPLAAWRQGPMGTDTANRSPGT